MNCPTWSEWIKVPDGGWRVSMAIPSALVTSAAVGDASMDQPTTRREYTSRTTEQYSLPSRVACSVMSVIHSWFGPPRANCRSTRSTAVGCTRTRRHLRRPLRQAGPAHQHLHRAMPDNDPAAEAELGVHPAAAVGATRPVMHVADQVGQPHVSNRAGRGARPRQA
jgi:hypothetical protein